MKKEFERNVEVVVVAMVVIPKKKTLASLFHILIHMVSLYLNAAALYNQNPNIGSGILILRIFSILHINVW